MMPCPHGWPKRSFCRVCRVADASTSGHFKFVAISHNVLQGQQVIARAWSKTMAKRIANALNKHILNREGV
jgi:hypothetical protein